MFESMKGEGVTTLRFADLFRDYRKSECIVLRSEKRVALERAADLAVVEYSVDERGFHTYTAFRGSDETEAGAEYESFLAYQYSLGWHIATEG